ncbi:MarR family transcriptional regulator [Sporosarcina sp.]|uniref:MarR family winged helix-turn-helix transcriptional regulator n=1 Tax=Sporosarcina sp. TaxID=49982 RepID=UPI00260CD369|nr:MarR family transcriptional regulator [Sporosarcina sp.]
MIESEIRLLLQTIAIQTRKNYAQQLRQLDLHIGQELALFHLWEQEGLTQSQLRNKMGSEASTVSNMLRKLEQDGIVYRTNEGPDHRISNVYLTEKGKQLKVPITKIWEEHEKQMLQGISNEELGTLRNVLYQMKENLTGE